jgi:NTE family protein
MDMPPPLDWLRSALEKAREFARAPRRAKEEWRRPRLGLALGGGFARGIAHIGIVKGLVEGGVPIDCIAGTSAGALIASAYATGVPLEQMARRARTTRFRDFGRWQLSWMGFASNDRLENYLSRVSGSMRFEEARIPLAIAATDLLTGEGVVFTSGAIGPALRGSCAYPGMFQPVEVDGRLLVDGFVAAPVPVEAVRQLGAEVVVAVFLESAERGERPKNMIEVVGRSFSILQRYAHREWRDKADVILEPAVGRFAWDDFSQTPELIAAGEECARRALPRIHALLEPGKRSAAGEAAAGGARR